jgi:hypothetical protein
VLAATARVAGDFDLAEGCVQEPYVAAQGAGRTTVTSGLRLVVVHPRRGHRPVGNRLHLAWWAVVAAVAQLTLAATFEMT